MGVDLINSENKDNLIKSLTHVILLIKPLGDVNKVAESGILGNKVVY